jgi:protein-L-isoaspartate(D-aspartate) O-methyltransferase
MNTDFARAQMIEQQIRTNGVSDPIILDVLGQLNRNKFVPAAFADLAFADCEIPLSHGQCMLRPVTEGKILQALALQADESVLEIGTGTGYFTACLARLAATVTSIDIHSDFIDAAEKNLADAGINNAKLHCMDMLSELPPDHYDAIVVSCSMPFMDERIISALQPGGRLFIVIGESPVKEAVLVTQNADQGWQTASLFETDLPALVNPTEQPSFSF